jgi:hypothetical protein
MNKVKISISIVWGSQTGEHQQEDLAKFGYRPNMKVI